MALLAEYALTPDVFDETSYMNQEVCGLYLQVVKDVLLQEGLVRDLRDGEWARLFSNGCRPWHRRGKELIRKLATQQRLAPCRAVGATVPGSDAEWCDEAVATHQQVGQLTGIIVTDDIAAGYGGEPLVASVGRLATTPWWTERSSSMRLDRTLADYQTALDLVLRHANSIMFIDPYVDPTRGHYRDFASLLQCAGRHTRAPAIEIHRVAWYGSSQDKRPQCSAIEAAFRRELTRPIQEAGMSIEVFLWDDFHDRYLISDLVGISVPNGFDTTRAPDARTTWTRLGRKDRDDVQREFHPASHRHRLEARFRIPE